MSNYGGVAVEAITIRHRVKRYDDGLGSYRFFITTALSVVAEWRDEESSSQEQIRFVNTTLLEYMVHRLSLSPFHECL